MLSCYNPADQSMFFIVKSRSLHVSLALRVPACVSTLISSVWASSQRGWQVWKRCCLLSWETDVWGEGMTFRARRRNDLLFSAPTLTKPGSVPAFPCICLVAVKEIPSWVWTRPLLLIFPAPGLLALALFSCATNPAWPVYRGFLSNEWNLQQGGIGPFLSSYCVWKNHQTPRVYSLICMCLKSFAYSF